MKKFVTILIWSLLLVLVTLVIYSNVIEIGLRLEETSIYLSYAFYVVSILLFYLLILAPMINVLLFPYYSVSKYCDEKTSNNFHIKARAKRLLKYGNLGEEDERLLTEAIKSKSKDRKKVLSQRMYIIYNNKVKQNIDKIIVDSSKDLLILTGVSQSHFMDMMIVLVNNFRLIQKIVVLTGFRPTFLRTIKLYIHVFTSSLIADGAQKVDVTSLVTTSLQGGAKLISESAINGAINALLMLRLGTLTKNYIYAKDPKHMKVTLLNNSIAEALVLFPQVLALVITSPIKGVASLFKPKPTTSNDYDLIEEADSKDIKVKWSRR